ncbi:uncharacterized protein LOC62_06G008699 [Vanrija pseudolonga]|uniref:Uncharacterized protein n=1 Tax=Vanrija pseudolonga TaxID=143232 RepID=A0AAF1BP87_9TREE|nr:hypothetical protein LOC62_06G008699 [Vanrija pseudolonga]
MTDDTHELASPESVLEALRVHIQPTLIVTRIPNVLKLYAHLELVSDALQEQAAKGLEIAKDGLEAEADISILKRCAKRDRGYMVMLPWLLCKAHLRLIIMSPKTAHQDSAPNVLDNYFPPSSAISATDPDKLSIFVGCLRPDDVDLMDDWRTEVSSWIKDASRARNNGLPPPTIDPVLTPKPSTAGEPGDKDIQTIADWMLKEAEAIVRLAHEYNAMFDTPAAPQA